MPELKVFRCTKGPSRKPYGALFDAADKQDAKKQAAVYFRCSMDEVYAYEHYDFSHFGSVG